MDSAVPIYFCPNCKLDQDGEETECQNCGCGLQRRISFSATLRHHGMLDGKLKDSRGKPRVSLKIGASRSNDGTWAYIEQLTDRVRKWYRKLVILADGTVHKDAEGPLDDQSLHGPPKRKP